MPDQRTGEGAIKDLWGTNNNLNMDYGLCHNIVSSYNVNFSDFYNMLLQDRKPIFTGNDKIFGERENDVSIIRKTFLHAHVCIYTQIQVCTEKTIKKMRKNIQDPEIWVKNIIEFLGFFSQVSLKFDVSNKKILKNAKG